MEAQGIETATTSVLTEYAHFSSLHRSELNEDPPTAVNQTAKPVDTIDSFGEPSCQFML
jgi:hypothetical protein